MKLGKSFIDRNLLGIKLRDTAECRSFWSWVDLSWVVSSKLRPGVGGFGLGRWVISANFQSESFQPLVVLAKV